MRCTTSRRKACLPARRKPAASHQRSSRHSSTGSEVSPGGGGAAGSRPSCRTEEHTPELTSLMRISYGVFCLQNKNPILTREQAYTREYDPDQRLLIRMTMRQ